MSRWLVFATVLSLTAASVDQGYLQKLEQWRTAREAKLKADDGWLTVAGLFWGVNMEG